MISSRTYLIPLDSIHINKDERYRYGDFSQDHALELAADIAKNDIIHLPVIDKQTSRLVVGGHRFFAWKHNRDSGIPCPFQNYKDWTLIPVRYATNATEAELANIELIENIKRRTLTWDVRAQTIYDIHENHRASSEKPWVASDTASLLGIPHTEVVRSLLVLSYLFKYPEDFANCTTLGAAYNVAVRKQERQEAAALDTLLGKHDPGGGYASAPKPVPGGISVEWVPTKEYENVPAPKDPEIGSIEAPLTSAPPLYNMDFADFASSYSGPPINLINADPPFGQNLGTSCNQDVRSDWLKYEDTPETFAEFMGILKDFAMSSCVSSSAHMIVWYNYDKDAFLREWYRENLPSWKLLSRPLIWFVSDSAGIVPDPQRYGRYNYETAHVLTRGDRKIVKVKNLAFPHPKHFEPKIHQSEKPLDLMAYFLSMFVDDTTVFLDPTSGSGNSVWAAQELGAKSVIGLEREEAIFRAAFDRWVSRVASPSGGKLILPNLLEDFSS